MKRFLWLSLVIFFAACKNNKAVDQKVSAKEDQEYKELLSSAQTFFQPISSVEIETPDPDKVALGKYLYFDTRLSGEGNISCNSCHGLNNYGVDNQRFSPGDAEGTFGTRNSPTTFYAALHKMQFWDGRAKDVEEQAGGPILNPLEHNIKDEAELVSRVKDVELYQDLFSKVYGEEGISFENITNAIGAFERTLIPESRFDQYLEGDEVALTYEEKRGLNTFINSAYITCHSGVVLGGQMFQKFGLHHEYWKHTQSETVDLGLYEVSEDETDKYWFKVPSLRNVVHTFPYFHDGSVDDLHDAVKIMGKLQNNLDLTDEEIDDIVKFLGSLSADLPEDVKKNPFD